MNWKGPCVWNSLVGHPLLGSWLKFFQVSGNLGGVVPVKFSAVNNAAIRAGATLCVVPALMKALLQGSVI